MTRFVQNGRAITPLPTPKKADKPRVLPTKGAYTSENLASTKKITTPNSGSF